MTDFLICGAGISGLLVARELLNAGATVLVLDQQAPGREASWAGGGIVSPLYPWRYSDAVTALASAAQAVYPVLADELRDVTGIDPQLNQCGLMMLNADDDVTALDWSARHGRAMQLLSADAIYAAEANLASGFERALWMPEVANVRNPRLLRALCADIGKNPNATILSDTEVLRLNWQGGRVDSVEVRSAQGRRVLSAGKFIVAAGAWSARLLAPLQATLPVAPVKGQMLLLKAETPVIRSIILTAGRYLIPRRDHHIVVGSTLENSGFDKTLTQNAYERLYDAALAMVPSLAQANVVGHWAGLRPAAPDGIPFIGAMPGLENLYINAGHYRNGLVLAPASARLLADIVLGRETQLDPTPYDPTRRLAALTGRNFTVQQLMAENSAPYQPGADGS